MTSKKWTMNKENCLMSKKAMTQIPKMMDNMKKMMLTKTLNRRQRWKEKIWLKICMMLQMLMRLTRKNKKGRIITMNYENLFYK